MKLKYYLRGLGIGIFISTFMMGIVLSNSKTTLSDEEVIVRAKQLGMIEDRTLTDTLTTEEDAEEVTADSSTSEDVEDSALNTDDATESDAPAEITSENSSQTENDDTTSGDQSATIESPEATTEISPETTPETTPEATTETTSETTSETTAENTTTESASKVTVTIVRGDSSDSVSRKLYTAGLVESATEFDKYLCANGYDKKLRVGVYEIVTTATDEEIAKIISN